jgi:alpha-N-acetylglucosaminidase
MAKADPQALWVQMGWTFSPGRGWSNPRLKAMINGVPKGKMILLDYVCEDNEVYPQTENYFGAPVIWCYLGNFGGNTHIVGPLNKVNQRLTAAMNNPQFTNLAGIGATLEGLNNQSVYECLFERAWAGTEMNLPAWFKTQAQCHAGGPDQAVEEAFDLLRTKILVDNASGIGGHGVIFQTVPRLVTNARRGWCDPGIPYDNADLIVVWGKLLQAGPTARAQDAYRFDLADVTRQALGNHGQIRRAQMLDAYMKKDAATFRELAAGFLEMGRDLDAFLGTRPEFLLGKWIDDARAFGQDAAEKDYYERNARILLTTWVGRGDYFTDYASKSWNGLISSFYLGRWEMYLKILADDLDKGEHSAEHQKSLEEKMKDFEWEWANQAGGQFKPKPTGDVYEMSHALYEKYVGKGLNTRH